MVDNLDLQVTLMTLQYAVKYVCKHNLYTDFTLFYI